MSSHQLNKFSGRYDPIEIGLTTERIGSAGENQKAQKMYQGFEQENEDVPLMKDISMRRRRCDDRRSG